MIIVRDSIYSNIFLAINIPFLFFFSPFDLLNFIEIDLGKFSFLQREIPLEISFLTIATNLYSVPRLLWIQSRTTLFAAECTALRARVAIKTPGIS